MQREGEKEKKNSIMATMTESSTVIFGTSGRRINAIRTSPTEPLINSSSSHMDNEYDLSDKYGGWNINFSGGIWGIALKELLGTYIFLLFAFTSATAINPLRELGIAIAHGIGLFLAVALFCADANPIVTVTKMFTGHNGLICGIVKIILQFAGAVLAAVTVQYGFELSLITAVPAVGSGFTYVNAFVCEMIFSMILVVAALIPLNHSKDMKMASGEEMAIRAILLGFVLTASVFVGGNISGASLNPWRALCPSMFTVFPLYAWLYYVAPFVGAIAAFLAYFLIWRASKM